MNRREFLETSALGATATALGLGAIENLINPPETKAANSGNTNKSGVADQVLSLPKGGGAIKGLGEKFQPDLHTGTGNFSVPIQAPQGRGGFQPELSLNYSTGAGNGVFGLGWDIGIPNVSRQTSKGVPVYDDDEDTFVLSGAEDLVPYEGKPDRYRPRTEGLFARILKKQDNNGVYWEVTSKNGITSYYGLDDESRVSFIEKNGRKKVFQWLLSKTVDPCGNIIVYTYTKDDKPDNFNRADIDPDEKKELERTEGYHEHYNQVYLTEIKYMNFREDGDTEDQFFMRILFDYGQYNSDGTEKEGSGTDNWDFRPDRFSNYRSGFEIRTVRRCKRILIKVRDEGQKGRYILTKAYELDYKPVDPEKDFSNLSFLTSVTLRGYRDGADKAFPPITFAYTEFWPEYRTFENMKAVAGSLPDRPLSDPNYELIDLTGNGLPDVIHTGKYGYRFWKNMGNGEFIGPKAMRTAPARVRLEQTGVQFADMNGNGKVDLLLTGGVSSGYYETTYGEEQEWERFHPYKRAPEFSFEDPNVRLVDIDGDGLIDVLKTDRRAFLWYRNKGDEGFDDPKPVRRSRNMDEFPDVYFSDPRVHLADMTGDGLQDIVYVHNRRIEYWPNLGHGRWGKRVLLANAPEIRDDNDPGGQYDPKRLFFSDVDGDGLADLVYVAYDCVKIWLNQNGNGWSKKNKIIRGTPPTLPNSVRLADMKGTGTSGVLWTYEPNSNKGSHYKYLDFTGGIKPYVLNVIENNLGASTVVEYKPSTFFWTEDMKKDEPWLTHLPFPVQVVSRVEAIDHIAKSKLVTNYSYHHGYYDGREREFRGFGRTDQLDTEEFERYKNQLLHDEKQIKRNLKNGAVTGIKEKLDNISYVPPILVKTWFHPGIYLDEKKYLEKIRSKEYYQGDSEAFHAHFQIEKGDVPFEAFRTLRGSILRTETYGLDGTEFEKHPYVVSENGFQVKPVQQKGNNKHGVFMAISLESFTYHYERNPLDPRISHTITHKIDEYGNVTKSLDIAYPRRGNPEYNEQKKQYIIYSYNDFINQDKPDKPYFIGYSCESKQVEILLPEGVSYSPMLPENVADLDLEASGHNLFSQVRNYYDGTEYEGLEFKEIGVCGLLTRSETLVLKKEHMEVYGERLNEQDFIDAGYKKDDIRNNYWWIQTQRSKYDTNQYYLPVAQLDPMGHKSTIEYDRFSFLPIKTTDPIGNEVESENDYIVMSPKIIYDVNDNRSGVVFDELGFVKRTAVMGKETEQKGDLLDADEHATTYIKCDLENFMNNGQPIWAHVYARDTHYYGEDENGDVVENLPTRWMKTKVFSDGFGREIQTKAKAEPGEVSDIFCNPRLVTSGWKIYNNKGWVVEQYEPFFSYTWEFEANAINGVSAKMIYDTLGRVLRTDNPDGTFTKVEFTPWQQKTYDANDTVLDSAWYNRMMGGNNFEKEAATKAAEHYNTPTKIALDTLGRTFLTIEDNGEIGKYETCSTFDIQGNVLSMKDPRSMNKLEDARYNAFEHQYDLLGNILHRWQMDSGERYMFLNAVGNQQKLWDNLHHLIETDYDDLNRLIKLSVTHDPPEGQKTERLAEKMIYGEFAEINDNPDDQKEVGKSLNLRGQILKQYDGAGLVSYEEYDFKGNLIRKKQQVLDNYKDVVNWDNDQNFMVDIPTDSSFTYDALNRVITSITPDGSITSIEYNEGGLLKKIKLDHAHENETKTIVQNIDYNARGQRVSIVYGNQITTLYDYDPLNFRLKSLSSKSDSRYFQDYHYFYDGVGNITTIQDAHNQTICYDNELISGDKHYTYDAVNRLKRASGRELLSNTVYNSHEDPPVTICGSHPNDTQALRNYERIYEYDESGNIVFLNHIANEGSWQRHYEYDVHNNHLIKTSLGVDRIPEFDYEFDEHGNHKNFTHIDDISWNFKDQMQVVHLKNGNKVHCIYDNSGMRVRKVVENNSGIPQNETIYLSDFEIFRKHSGNNLQEEIETLHIIDDENRVVLIETRTVHEGNEENPNPKLRYQLSDHLGSSVVEVTQNAQPITYEEYFPYGGTAYHEQNTSYGFSAKRYRYSEKEKDEETGFYYYGVRYYCFWLLRWIKTDPIMQYDPNSDFNLYAFCLNNPTKYSDFLGCSSSNIDVYSNYKPERVDQPTFTEKGVNFLISDYKRMPKKLEGKFDAKFLEKAKKQGVQLNHLTPVTWWSLYNVQVLQKDLKSNVPFSLTANNVENLTKNLHLEYRKRAGGSFNKNNIKNARFAYFYYEQNFDLKILREIGEKNEKFKDLRNIKWLEDLKFMEKWSSEQKNEFIDLYISSDRYSKVYFPNAVDKGKALKYAVREYIDDWYKLYKRMRNMAYTFVCLSREGNNIHSWHIALTWSEDFREGEVMRYDPKMINPLEFSKWNISAGKQYGKAHNR